jgi:hypothetical protein
VRRALLVGIDRYGTFGHLAGCVNDVDALRPLLARHENNAPNFACDARYDLDLDELKQRLDGLLSPGADVALFYFAGHGFEHGSDVSLCTRDGTQTTPGFRMSELLGMVQQSKVAEVVIILDCCFSGAAGGVPQLGPDNAVLRQGLSILAASRGDQTSAEQSGRGMFSLYLEGALDGGAADVLGKVTVASVYAYLTELFGPWNQRPTFKANVDRLHELRVCRPAVPVDELRELPVLFPTPNYDFALDPSYEPDAEPQNSEHEAIFALLQRCRAAKLVEPVGEDHMYYAAINSRSCMLTALGRHYWRMANLGLL